MSMKTLEKRIEYWVKTQTNTAGWEQKLKNFINVEITRSVTNKIINKKEGLCMAPGCRKTFKFQCGSDVNNQIASWCSDKHFKQFTL